MDRKFMKSHVSAPSLKYGDKLSGVHQLLGTINEFNYLETKGILLFSSDL